MQIRQLLETMVAVAMMTSVSVALAESGPIDKGYEDSKAAEISSARLRLATRPPATGVQELNEAEATLRRLKETKAADARRKVASELELAVTRLNLVANGSTNERP